jgi:cytochrome oxidase assembly protein ShyY1
MVPEHELASTPPKFFWFDLVTLRQHLTQNMNGDNNAMAKDQNAKLVSVDASSTDNSDISGSSDVPFVTAVSGSDNTNGIKALQDIVWPVTPTADKVGDFKVGPTMHAGYAFTWFGLSGAGLYMMRMLVTRGRK